MMSVLCLLMLFILYFAVRLGKFERRIDAMEGIVKKSATETESSDIVNTRDSVQKDA